MTLDPNPNGSDWPAGFSYSNQTIDAEEPAVGVYTITATAISDQNPSCGKDVVTISVVVLPDSDYRIVSCYSEILDSLPEFPIIANDCGMTIEPYDTIIAPAQENWKKCDTTVNYIFRYKDCQNVVREWKYTYFVINNVPPTLYVPRDTVDAVHALNAAGTDCVYSYPVIAGSVVKATAHCGSYVGSAINYTCDIDTTQTISQEDTVKYVKVTVTATDVCNNSSDTTVYVKVPARLQLNSSDTVQLTCFGDNNGPQIPMAEFS